MADTSTPRGAALPRVGWLSRLSQEVLGLPFIKSLNSLLHSREREHSARSNTHQVGLGARSALADIPHSIPAKFDAYRDSYQEEVQRSIGFIGQDLDFFAEAKARHLLELAREHLGDLSKAKVLDVGCGIGVSHRYLQGFGSLHGVDVSAELIEAASKQNSFGHYQCYKGPELPFADESFDLVFAVNVLHHLGRETWLGFVGEMRRVAKPRGLVVVFEHNPLNPLTQLAVARCKFDDDCVLLRRPTVAALFSASRLELVSSKYVLFFPFRAKTWTKLERWMANVPFGAQYLVAGEKGN